jgi:hypothetical protein
VIAAGRLVESGIRGRQADAVRCDMLARLLVRMNGETDLDDGTAANPCRVFCVQVQVGWLCALRRWFPGRVVPRPADRRGELPGFGGSFRPPGPVPGKNDGRPAFALCIAGGGGL